MIFKLIHLPKKKHNCHYVLKIENLNSKDEFNKILAKAWSIFTFDEHDVYLWGNNKNDMLSEMTELKGLLMQP